MLNPHVPSHDCTKHHCTNHHCRLCVYIYISMLWNIQKNIPIVGEITMNPSMFFLCPRAFHGHVRHLWDGILQLQARICHVDLTQKKVKKHGTKVSPMGTMFKWCLICVSWCLNVPKSTEHHCNGDDFKISYSNPKPWIEKWAVGNLEIRLNKWTYD